MIRMMMPLARARRCGGMQEMDTALMGPVCVQANTCVKNMAVYAAPLLPTTFTAQMLHTVAGMQNSAGTSR